MSRDGTWGDHIVLQAMADMFGHDVSIVSSVEAENYVTILTPSPGTAARKEPPLLLGHYAENHYASLDRRRKRKRSAASVSSSDQEEPATRRKQPPRSAKQGKGAGRANATPAKSRPIAMVQPQLRPADDSPLPWQPRGLSETSDDDFESV
ncbi:PREDICTED: uncharacterized protein LOC109474521 isoform X2 [Branchiostoma belcheri]|uniref:Uncharacterized protein LOC109474521 isoform X2 n=1 Tax=Branchiostoma belcheri TaxID=7741 RepID=A0A6P4Z910_BRABE|nr:PREDICTED: uncharacterized protein LOC109474521 isoform X2 [Branchiostoma belcheri]